MNKKEIGEMEARLHEIKLRVTTAGDEYKENRYATRAIEDMAGYLLTFNDRMKDLEERKRINDGLEESVNAIETFADGFDKGHDKGYDEGFNDGFTAGSRGQSCDSERIDT